MTASEAAAAPVDRVFQELKSATTGLTAQEATRRLTEQAPNAIGTQSRSLYKILEE
jgi:hypothetical protein